MMAKVQPQASQPIGPPRIHSDAGMALGPPAAVSAKSAGKARGGGSESPSLAGEAPLGGLAGSGI